MLDEAAAWLQAKGVDQWPARFEMSWITGAIRRRETRLVLVGGVVAATVTLDRADALWGDLPGAAGYVHRLAVRRWASGLGGVVLDWAVDSVRDKGGEALRLDCVATNARLREYYETVGFEHRGDLRVATAGPSGPSAVVVSRYELRLTA